MGYRSNSRRNIRIIDSPLFFLLYRAEVAELYKIAICQMVGWFPPYHVKGKRH